MNDKNENAYVKLSDVRSVINEIAFDVLEDMFFTSAEEYYTAKRIVDRMRAQVDALDRKEL